MDFSHTTTSVRHPSPLAVLHTPTRSGKRIYGPPPQIKAIRRIKQLERQANSPGIDGIVIATHQIHPIFNLQSEFSTPSPPASPPCPSHSMDIN